MESNQMLPLDVSSKSPRVGILPSECATWKGPGAVVAGMSTTRAGAAPGIDEMHGGGSVYGYAVTCDLSCSPPPSLLKLVNLKKIVFPIQFGSMGRTVTFWSTSANFEPTG